MRKTARSFLYIILSVYILAGCLTAGNNAAALPLKSQREGFAVLPISDELFFRMKQGNTFKENCIVPREDLRYIQALHKDKDGNVHLGEMVVHSLIAEDVLEIFEKLYDAA